MDWFILTTFCTFLEVPFQFIAFVFFSVAVDHMIGNLFIYLFILFELSLNRVAPSVQELCFSSRPCNIHSNYMNCLKIHAYRYLLSMCKYVQIIVKLMYKPNIHLGIDILL